MSFARPTELEMAFHEAGHAYCFAAISKGDLPVAMGLESMAGGFRGWSKRLKIAETEAAEQMWRDEEDYAAYDWIIAAEATIALAGPLAEARQRERSAAAGRLFLYFDLPQLLAPTLPTVDDDMRRLRELLPSIASDVHVLKEARKLLGRASDILDDCWPGVERLARRLLAERQLAGSSLEDHFERWPARTVKS